MFFPGVGGNVLLTPRTSFLASDLLGIVMRVSPTTVYGPPHALGFNYLSSEPGEAV